MAENGRLKYMETIAKRFTEVTMAHRREVKAIVTRVPHCGQIRSKLSSLSYKGEEVLLVPSKKVPHWGFKRKAFA